MKSPATTTGSDTAATMNALSRRNAPRLDVMGITEL
jgi:hypothetical protein